MPSGDALAALTRLVLSPPPPAAAASPAAGGKAGQRRKGKAGKGKSSGGGKGGAARAAPAGPYPRGMLVVVLDEMDGLLASHSSGERGGAVGA